jgi:hypothetical protein
MNFWLLFAIENGANTCVQVALFGTDWTNRLAQLIEIIWSFCIPATLILYMDASVMLVRSHSPNFLSNAPHQEQGFSSTRSLQTVQFTFVIDQFSTSD